MFAGMERHLDKRVDAIEQRLTAMETKFEARFEKVETKIEKVETTLLTEFHKWASPAESRLRTHRVWFYEVDSEVEALKERVSKLEKPPQ